MYKRVTFAVESSPELPVFLDDDQIKAVSAIINAFVKDNVKHTNSFNVLVASIQALPDQELESSRKKKRRGKKGKKKHYKANFITEESQEE